MKTSALIVLLMVALCGSLHGYAQEKKCLAFESLQDFRNKTPGTATDAEFESWIKQNIQASAKNGVLLSSYTIPIVFHIIHNGEAIGTGSNLSAAQIQQQLAQLNADFANASGSKYAVAANANIQFSLAVIDPQGRKLAEPGIERINLKAKGWPAPPYDVSTFNSFADQNILPQTIWNPYAYFNVWVLDIAGNILGRSTFPSFSGINDINGNLGETDDNAGVLLQYKSVGSKTAPGANTYWGGQGRTLTHEAGHFFGLRHIWGDADCGNDYCTDTPTQLNETEGCSGTTAASGCTDGGNRMFENYMDYTWDNCVNTFTANQVARMQAVMQNSPRRVELATAGTDVAPATNIVQFENPSFSFPENGVNTTACPAYREVKVNLNLFEAAAEAATLQFIINGTAQEGVDFELVTPTLTFNAGDAVKTLVLRIFDDAAMEGNEQIELQYAISGNGLQPANENQTLTIEISDNDGVTAVSNSGLVTLLQEDFDGNSIGNSSWSVATFISPAGLNKWSISPNGGTGIFGNSAHITSNTSTGINNYNINSESDVLLKTGAIDARGKSNITLSFNYKCVGEVGSNGYLNDYGILLYSLDGYNFQPVPDIANNYYYLFYNSTNVVQFKEDLSAILGGKHFYLGFEWYNDALGGSGVGFTIDDISITSEALAVGQTTGEMAKQTVSSGQPILLKNTSSTALIAKIENAASNMGCVTATITQAGTMLQPITTNAGSFQRTQKVVQITPQQQTAATVTLYFTDAELVQWSASKGILKVLKVKDGVSLNGVLTAKEAEIITPVVTTFPAEGYTAYTFSVSSFSQFMLVSPTITLPVKLVHFEAQPAGRQIELAWQTAGERENKGFWLERSTNGSDFEKLTWVEANSSFNYRYADRFVQPGQAYYYRLQQQDYNGQQTYSAIRQAKVAGAGIALQVTPNPATDHIKVFISGSRQPATFSLYNAAGSRVGHWQGASRFGEPFTISVAHLPKGIYTIIAVVANEMLSQKIIKQ